MPSRAYTSLLRKRIFRNWQKSQLVSMPSRAYTSLLRRARYNLSRFCQVVSMPSRAYTSLLLSVWQLNLLKRLGTCQCPLGLIPHCYAENFKKMVDNAELVSMPSRAYTSLLQGMFEFMGFREYCVNALSGLYLIVTRICRNGSW